MSNTRLVYATDGSHICKNCKKNPCKCRTKVEIIPSHYLLKVRLEKNQRGGKNVTVIFNLPLNDDYFAELTKKLKNHCGSGGTFKNNQIEVQGDHKSKVIDYLIKLGFKAVPAGG